MKNLLKIGILILLLSNTIEVKAQSIPYKIHPTSKKISNFNHIFQYTKLLSYDVDFAQWKEIGKTNFKVLIEIKSDGTGRMVTDWDDEGKTNFSILSCTENKFANSLDYYWGIECKSSNGKLKTFYLNSSNNTFSKFWYEGSDNTRVYFDN